MDKIKRNPSRKDCEETIRRILMTEVLENGSNKHFKSAKDFMKYFESLYPAGESLNKQVQRAVKALEMPKDEAGYFIINKTAGQMDEDKELGRMFRRMNAKTFDLEKYETLFLKVDGKYKDYLMQLISESKTFEGKYVTMISASEGIIFYTESKSGLETLISSLI